MPPPAAVLPGVFVEEDAGGRRPIQGVDTATALFVGRAARGPRRTAATVRSAAELERRFGAGDAPLVDAVRRFFDNGGRVAKVMRIDAGGSSGPGDPSGSGDPAFLAALSAAFGPPEAGGARLGSYALLCVPGLSDPQAIARLLAACGRLGAFMLVDAPAGATVAGAIAAADAIRQRAGEHAAFGAMGFPWLVAADPSAPSATRTVPPCGFLAGLYARTDAARGVWRAPAGVEATLRGASGPALALDDRDSDALNRAGVCGLRALPGRGLVAWGARTLAADAAGGSPWRFVPVRRLASFVEQSLLRGLRWTVFEPDGEPLRARLRADVGGFLHGLFRQGAFAGASPNDAWLVRCDAGTTTAADAEAGIVVVLVGIAPMRPAEFVLLRLALRVASGRGAGGPIGNEDGREVEG